MRKVIEKQLKFGQVDICSIQIDLHSRDEILQILLGLQAIYSDHQVREEVFTILESIIPKHTLIPAMVDLVWIYGRFWCWAHYV